LLSTLLRVAVGRGRRPLTVYSVIDPQGVGDLARSHLVVAHQARRHGWPGGIGRGPGVPAVDGCPCRGRCSLSGGGALAVQTTAAGGSYETTAALDLLGPDDVTGSVDIGDGAVGRTQSDGGQTAGQEG
jgi:hypothetical protein